jgi:hypothetical protein
VRKGEKLLFLKFLKELAEPTEEGFPTLTIVPMELPDFF